MVVGLGPISTTISAAFISVLFMKTHLQKFNNIRPILAVCPHKLESKI